MSEDVPVKCTCGKVTGTIKKANRGKRVVCMCRSCQAYAHHLDRATDVLDMHGGTEVVQLTPSQLELQTGSDEVRCVQLTPKGALRWFAGCCKTPIANTMDKPQAAFAGVLRLFMDLTDEEMDSSVGSKVHRIQARNGHNEATGHDTVPPMFIASSLVSIVSRSLAGQAQPSIFFDPATKAPRVTPLRVSAEDYKALRERAKQAP